GQASHVLQRRQSRTRPRLSRAALSRGAGRRDRLVSRGRLSGRQAATPACDVKIRIETLAKADISALTLPVAAANPSGQEAADEHQRKGRARIDRRLGGAGGGEGCRRPPDRLVG